MYVLRFTARPSNTIIIVYCRHYLKSIHCHIPNSYDLLEETSSNQYSIFVGASVWEDTGNTSAWYTLLPMLQMLQKHDELMVCTHQPQV